MSYIDSKILEGILWTLRTTVPNSGPELKQNTSRNIISSAIDTGLGFSIDHWDLSVKIIYKILSNLNIVDQAPTIKLATYTNNKLEHQIETRVPESEEPPSLASFLLSGTGSYLLQPDPAGGYIVDLSQYQQYQVRDGYEKYGGKVHITNGSIDWYEYLGITYPAVNPHVEKIIRATLCLKIMVEMHALRIHLGTGQKKALWYHSNDFDLEKLNDLFYLMTFETLTVNRKIPILIGPGGLISRLFALTPDSYIALVKNTLIMGELSRREILGTPLTVWNKEITKYMKIVESFIGELNECTPGLNLTYEEIKDIADFFVTATAMHNQFGDSQVYSMVISHFFLPKVYKSKPGYISELDQDLLNTLLAAVTPKFPYLVDDFVRNIFTDEEQRAAWDTFIDTLKDKYTKMGWFDPFYFETSIGF